MASEIPAQKSDLLRKLGEEIKSHADWWLFPTQGPIQGFWGTGQIFIVGDQPSTDEWGPDNLSRIMFYEILQSVGLQNAHLTDLYKKRGFASALEQGLPADFRDHVNLFQREIQILKPTLIVGLGGLAQRLLIQNLHEWEPKIPRIWHFSYVVREGVSPEQYKINIRNMIFGQQ